VSLLEGERLSVVDTETTGVSPAYGATIVELARVEIENGRALDAWSCLVRPRRPIPPGATAVHGITDAMVAAAPAAADVAASFRDSLEGRTLVFHNASFDLPFLVAMIREAGLPRILNPVVDTLGLARGLFGSGSNTLAELAGRLGLEPEGFHRARVDAQTTAGVFLALAALWEVERGVGSLAELAAASQDEIRAARR
jgi:DNA polymerase-3 subunit epsilon